MNRYFINISDFEEWGTIYIMKSSCQENDEWVELYHEIYSYPKKVIMRKEEVVEIKKEDYKYILLLMNYAYENQTGMIKPGTITEEIGRIIDIYSDNL